MGKTNTVTHPHAKPIQIATSQLNGHFTDFTKKDN
jgi:hypothetical protein